MKQKFVAAVAIFSATLVLFSAEIRIEEKRILDIVNKFLNVLETGDVTSAKEILMTDGSNFSVREEGDSLTIKHTDYKTLIGSLPKTKGKYKEVINDPKVLIHGNIAVVWTEYKFYIDNQFSHCGMDSFSLIKDENKWKIASIIYTVEKKGCEESQ